ncbi:mechanosensitive ion channel domain-containing protein [Dubosiella newyorkensis]|uniref:mechanosensitive ion channel domain-containing protein n=1 Tax=Dubosiella newyorkensis TaxID=1862672 RepID=UPI003F675F05
MWHNVAGGIQIVLTKPFYDGDYVEIGTYAGTVTSIDTMFTTLLHRQPARNRRSKRHDSFQKWVRQLLEK